MDIDIEKLGLDFSGENSLHPGRGTEQDGRHELASLIAYTLGVGGQFFGPGKSFDDVFTVYEKDDNLKVIRAAASLRTSLMRGISRIARALKDGRPLIEALKIDEDIYAFLSRKNIIVNNTRSTNAVSYVIECNNVIKERLGNCRKYFPGWVPWKYISNIFVIPVPAADQAAYGREIARFHENINCYPYKCYLYWPGSPRESGNILYNDEKFARWLFECNGDEFCDISRVKDIRAEKKEAVYNFLDGASNAVALVDCENTDPYRLFAALNGLSSHTDKLSKLILVDDPHTAPVWKLLENQLDIPVVHIITERVSKEKSLVDHRLIIQAMQEYYENHADSFIIISSDSDFSELIRNVKANFIVFLDRERVGHPFISFLQERAVPFCNIDEFLSKSGDELKMQFLRAKIEARLKELFENGLDDVVLSVLRDEHLVFNGPEKKELLRKAALGTKITFSEGKAHISVSLS